MKGPQQARVEIVGVPGMAYPVKVPATRNLWPLTRGLQNLTREKTTHTLTRAHQAYPG